LNSEREPIAILQPESSLEMRYFARTRVHARPDDRDRHDIIGHCFVADAFPWLSWPRYSHMNNTQWRAAVDGAPGCAGTGGRAPITIGSPKLLPTLGIFDESPLGTQVQPALLLYTAWEPVWHVGGVPTLGVGAKGCVSVPKAVVTTPLIQIVHPARPQAYAPTVPAAAQNPLVE